MRNKRSGSLLWTLKDYTVPLVGVFIIILVIYFWFFSTGGWELPNHENQVGIGVELSNSTDEAYIVYSWDFKKKIEANMSLYKWEKILVKDGNVKLVSNDIWTFNINKIGEFKYNEDASFSLYSSDVWVDSKLPLTVSMRYAMVNIGQNSHVNLTQNEVGSTIYLLDGMVEVKNLGWKSTVLSKWQKIMIASIDTTKTDVDLSLEKVDLDDTFKTSDWYIRNNWDVYLSTGSSWSFLGTGTFSSATWFVATWSTQSKSLISLENLQDEQTFSEPSITINGSYDSDNIANIKLNSTDAIIDKNEKRFSIKDFALINASNELVLKVYDDSNQLLWKYPYTVYLKWAPQDKTPFDVKNFSLDATNFKFISPKSNPYTTSDDVVMIEWMVPARTVSYIEINDFRLWKFPKNGTYWKYFANKQFWNLQDGLNVYEVKYYADDGKILHENAFTIIKTSSWTSVQPSQTWVIGNQ